jgi:enoyl-CoA hydratase/carnithine racemase
MSVSGIEAKYERLSVEIQDHLYLIGLNRANKRNAFDLLMLRELAQAYTAYEENPDLWCAVLFAHGDHFTAGLDLTEVGPAVLGGQKLFPDEFVDPFGLYGRRLSKPMLCAVQGYCLTIGVELLLASDIRLAASNTKFGQIEVRRGIMPFGGATLRLPQIAGWGNAMRYLLTGDMFDATEALRIGVIQESTAPELLQQRVLELAHTVAKQAPLAVQASLASAHKVIDQGYSAAIDHLIPQVQTLMQSQDAYEGMMSFIERREADFKGK